MLKRIHFCARFKALAVEIRHQLSQVLSLSASLATWVFITCYLSLTPAIFQGQLQIRINRKRFDLPWRLIVHVVLFPLSRTTTLVGAAILADEYIATKLQGQWPGLIYSFALSADWSLSFLSHDYWPASSLPSAHWSPSCFVGLV